jgi:hypothetical protein
LQKKTAPPPPATTLLHTNLRKKYDLKLFCIFFLKERTGRPQKLKVFINPYSKKGKAPIVYDTLVAPLFKKAGIKTDVISKSS